jgi:hypothetical protein
VSETDSFIDEVAEEVRRDRLFSLFRRYGWIAIAAIVLIVGTAAVLEFRKARERAAAQDFGDAVLTALETGDPAARRTALEGIGATGSQAALLRLLSAGAATTEATPASREAAAEALDAVAADAALPTEWRDLAALRRALLTWEATAPEARRAALEPLSAAGRPYRVLALEHLALNAIEAGDPAAARTILTALQTDQEATPGLRRRTAQLIVVLGDE